jgi:hypothetical protein
MKSIINFMKTMLIMPIHWQAWLGILVTANIVVPMFYIHTLEAQVILATAIVGLMIMAFIFSMKGFVRLMGIGHFGWLPLVFWLGMRLEHAPADSLFGYWLMAVVFLDSLSLFIDTADVLRYVKGERQPFLALNV